ncbi:hypothetical protein [Paraburkholderia adhaesiva]|uniref:hypothetical protein n=1 Tax=Paraburkholderia adhaesiva TaxID=2883244 RepID=UPI001F1B628E|nr:hypothetical protein [Paraburkholderia adhaesiva]
MAQVANYQVPAHPSGLEMRTQLNQIILALIGDNTGPTEPTQTFPGMMWGNTSNHRLYRRTNANDGWVDIGPLDDFLGDVKGNVNYAIDVANQKVARTGDTMTGRLTMGNGAGNRPEIALKRLPDQVFMYLRGPDSTAGSGVEFINNAYNAVVANIDDGGNLQFNGRIKNEVEFWGADYNGGSARVMHGGIKMAHWGYGAYADFARTRDQDFRWRIHYNVSNDYLEFVNNGWGAVVMGANSNIWCSGYGWVWDHIFDAKNIAWGAYSSAYDRAPIYATCQWNSGILEAGPISVRQTIDAPAPWVSVGWRSTSDGNWITNSQFIRFILLRNA